MQTQIKGQNFSIDGTSIEIFCLSGSPSGQYWAISVDPFGTGYFMAEVDPCPASDEVSSLIRQDEAEGNLDKIRMLVVSNRVAVRLWLEGVLEHRHFKGAQEGVLEDVPFLRLPEVMIGGQSFPLGILPETVIGAMAVCTLDENCRIVGTDDEVLTIALPAPETLVEIECN